MHWSRPLLASLLIVLAAILIFTAMLVEMMDLIADQRAGGGRSRSPDRINGVRPVAAQSERPLFDEHAQTYEADCMRGLSLSGESPSYFADARAEKLAKWWSESARPAPLNIVDYGCGTGEGTLALARKFPQAKVVGLDISAQSIMVANERCRDEQVEFATLDQTAAELPRADLFHMSGVLHHVDPNARNDLLAVQQKYLADDGVIAIFENNPLNPGTRWVMSRIPFDRDAIPLRAGELRERLQGTGFAIRDVYYLFWFPRILAALRPLESLLTRIPFGAQYAVIASKH